MLYVAAQVDEWVAVWLNDDLVRYATTVTHTDNYGDVIEIGKTNTTSSITPTGALRCDDVAFRVPRVDDVWVDAVDNNGA